MSKNPKPTSFDIAFRAGVSQSTVSRALRNSPLVNQETRDRVQAIARELNYKIDKNARNLRAQSTRTLALLLCEDPGTDTMINPFFLAMLGSITRATARREYDLLVSFQQLSNDWQADYEDANRADGIIFLGYGDYTSYKQKAESLVEANAHFITWGPVVEGQPGHSIACDNQFGGELATKHLLSLGRKRIAFLGDISERCPEFRTRYKGYCNALDEAGIEVNPNLQITVTESSDEAGYEAAKELLARGANFDAVFGVSDLITLGALPALREAGMTIPGDVAVVGFDDIPAAKYSSPSLTTIEQNPEVAGEVLVEKLLKLIAGEEISSSLIPPRLIVRESCGSAAHTH